MKLSCVLLLALAPVNAVDSQPQVSNLRGIAAIALSDEESAPVMTDGIDFVQDSFRGGPPANSCRKVTLWCSTNPDAMASHKCCNNLTCQPSVHVKNESSGNANAFDGICVANGPGVPTSSTAGGRYGQSCRLSGEQCNDNSASVTTKCCNDGVTDNLVCNSSTGAGTCVDATPSVPGIDFVKEGRGWSYHGNPHSCRGIVGQSCSSTSALTSHKCCENLTCEPNDEVSYPFNGKCAEATAPGEIDE